MAEETISAAAEPQNKSAGPVIGIVIIVVVLILGALYFWGQRISEIPTPEEITASPDQALMMLERQGTSDDVSAIETDLNSTKLEGLDTEMQTIDKELGNF